MGFINRPLWSHLDGECDRKGRRCGLPYIPAGRSEALPPPTRGLAEWHPVGCSGAKGCLYRTSRTGWTSLMVALFVRPSLTRKGRRFWAKKETVARRRSATLLSEFGLGHVREYAPFDLILGALHLILRAKSQHICFKYARMAFRAKFSHGKNFRMRHPPPLFTTTNT